MTTVEDQTPLAGTEPLVPSEAHQPEEDPRSPNEISLVPGGLPPSERPWAPGRAAVMVGIWLVVTILAVAVTSYGFGPLFQERDQRTLMTEYRANLYDASQAVAAPGGQTTVLLPPTPGSPVGILEIASLHLQEVVVEGVAPSQTEEGPGHVPGTAGFGDPGNAVIVARRAAFGGPFADLGSLRPGTPILITTTQGQSVYKVSDVARTTISHGSAAPSPSVVPVTGAAPLVDSAVAVDTLYGPTADNRLTLVTSASDVPWNTSKAIVVTAEMVGPPFAPTPQAGRSDTFTGTNGSAAAVAPLVLVLFGYVVIALGAIVAYRRYSPRAAWLLSTAPLLVLIVLLAEIGCQLLPAWL